MNKESIIEELQFCEEICKPLSWAEREYVLRHICSQWCDMKLRQYPPVTTQHHVGELKDKYEQSAALRSLCAAVMHYRDEQSAGVYMPHSQRYSSAARYALMQGNRAAFLRAQVAYARSTAPMSPGPELVNEAFWNDVLGEDWRGYHVVPAGAARDEIARLVALRYTMYTTPEGNIDELIHASPDLMMAHCILRMDNRPATLPPENLPRHVRPLVQLYWALRVGNWAQALREISAYFDEQKAPRSNMSALGNGPLYLVGLLLSIQEGSSVREVARWHDGAADLLLRVLPAADKAHIQEVSECIEFLSLWDAAQNRTISKYRLPRRPGALPLVALAFAARALSGLELPLEAMVAAIEEVEARGVSMLSVYAASSLMGLSKLPPELRKRLRLILDQHKNFAPLFTCDIVDECSDDAPGRLIRLIEQQGLPPQNWLYWDMKLSSDLTLQSLTPRCVSKKPQSTGVALELCQVLDAELVTATAPELCDIAMVGLAELLQERVPESNLPLVADVLAGHPRLRVIEDSYRRPVSVLKVKPVICVEQLDSHICFSMDAGQFLRFRRISKNELALPGYTSKMQQLIRSLSERPVQVDLSRTDELRWLLASLSRDFEVQGDLPPELGDCAASAAALQLRVTRSPRGCSFELLVQHCADSTELSVPGQGERILLVPVAGGGNVCVQRDLLQEVHAAKTLLEDTPGLRGVEIAPDYSWRMSDTQQSLLLLHELGRRVSLIWDGELPELHILQALPEARLSFTLRRRSESWLEIGAQLTVDEDRVVELSALLEAYRRRQGDFLPLADDTYLLGTPELMAHLSRLEEVLLCRDQTCCLPLAAMPALAADWQGELPEVLRAHMPRLQECSEEAPPAALSATLREYQVQGYRWMLARVRAGLGSCLADDMGLGKTIQMLALLLKCADAGPSLVVAPLSLCANWQTEAGRFAPSLRVSTYAECLRGDRPAPHAGDIIIASYGQLISGAEFFCGVEWNIVALDEAQAIKNPDSRRAAVVGSLRAAARLCLTGTPVENSPLDMWSIMHFLNPHLLGTRKRFSARCRSGESAWRRTVAPLILRRTKQEVLPQLPPITELRIGVELTEEERALYESIRRRAVERVEQGGDSISLLAELTRLRRLCCHGKLAIPDYSGPASKLEAMLNLAETLRSSGHSVLVFSQFTDVLDLAQAALHERGFTTLRLDGSTPASKRKERVAAFQRGEAQVFLISLKAGGFGLNLTAADYVILMDPWWNPAVEAQAAGRSHRLGQRNPVTVCRLIACDTVEERVMQMHETKKSLARDILSGSGLPLELLKDILQSV